MTSLFQTASGAWHIPSILMVASWIVGFLVTGGFIFANLRVNRNDRIRAFQTQQAAEEKISRLEVAARKQPLRDRLIAQLNLMDKTIIEKLAGGQTSFSGIWDPSDFTDLQRLSREPGADLYIAFRSGPSVVSNAGTFMSASFDLTDLLLKP